MVLAVLVGCPADEPTPDTPPAGPTTAPETVEEKPLVWLGTDVGGVEVLMPEGEGVTARLMDARPKLPEGVTAVGPTVLVEVAKGASYPRAVRLPLPEGEEAAPTEAGHLALACNTLSYGQSLRTVTSGWHVQAATLHADARTLEAAVGHASGWTVVRTKDKPTQWLNDHFRIHFEPKDVTEAQVRATAEALEKAYRKLESFGLRFGRTKKNRLDVYFKTVRSATGDVVYAGHQLAKGGGTYILVNLPKNIPNFNLSELRITIGHELFHELQYRYQNISTFQDVHLPGLQKISTKWYSPGGWLVDQVFDLPEYDYPLGWLNEAMSTWFQLHVEPTWQPEHDAPLYGNAIGFLTKGLKGLHTDDGYGGAVFLDYLVRRAGTGLIREILLACKKQGRKRNGLAALKEACLRCAVIKQDPSLATFDTLWWDFARDLLADDGKHFDARLDRRRMVPTDKAAMNIAVGRQPTTRKYVTWLAPHAARLQAFRLRPAERPTEQVRIICKVRQIPAEPRVFPVWGALFGSPSTPGSHGLVPAGSGKTRHVSPDHREATVVLEVPKDQRDATLYILSAGVWGDAVPKATDTCQVTYEVAFVLADDRPRDLADFFPRVRYFPGNPAPWQVSKGKITDRATGRVRSANRTYFYQRFKRGGGRPDILLLFRVKVTVFSAPMQAEAALLAQRRKIAADERVVNLKNVPVGQFAFAYGMKGVREYYDKETRTCDKVLLWQDKYVAEVQWTCFKTRDLWANRRDVTLGMAKEVAERIAGTFQPVYPLPPGGDAMARAEADAAAVIGPAEAEPVTLYALALSQAATQRFHEPWYDRIVELQATAQQAHQRTAERFKDILDPVRLEGSFTDPARLAQAMREQKTRWEAEEEPTPAQERELEVFDEKLAVVQNLAAQMQVARKVEALWAKAGRRSMGVGARPPSLPAPALWPNRVNDPDPAKAGDADAVYEAKQRVWRRLGSTVNKPESMRRSVRFYARQVEAAQAVHALKPAIQRYNTAAKHFQARVEAGDYRPYLRALRRLPEGE